MFMYVFHCFDQWNLLLRDYNVAKEYIEDIRDICDNFEGLCQRNLAANTGCNCKVYDESVLYISVIELLFHIIMIFCRHELLRFHDFHREIHPQQYSSTFSSQT